MKLSLMKRFFDTVDDDWWSLNADQLASPWFKGEHRVRVHRASANFVCRVEADDSTYYLRFNHSSERNPEKINSEIQYLLYLREKGVNANKPIPSLSRKYVESIQTGLGVFHAVLFEAVPGGHLESDELDLHGFHRWGRALGELHKASVGYNSNIPSWKDTAAYIQDIITGNDQVVHKELESVVSALELLPVDKSSFGVIHYDFELDNICWDDGVPGIMDFDDCVYQWYAADIVYALRDLFDDKVSQINLEDERFQSFISGYRSIKPITDESLENMPLHFRLHNLHTYARIHRSISDAPIPDEPGWVTNLRAKLAQSNNEYRTELIQL